MIRESMLSLLKKLRVKLFTSSGPGRQVEVQDDDVFIVSYPKSGNTWVRYMLAYILSKGSISSLAEMNDTIPDIYTASKNKLKDVRSHRFLKSHEYFDPRYQKVIYLVRDPRDVLISLYYYRKRWSTKSNFFTIDEFADSFVESGKSATWGEHVGSWYGARQDDTIIYIKYEDLIEDAKGTLKCITDHVGLQCTDDSIVEAVEAASFDKMKKREMSKDWDETKLAYNKHVKFFRSGSTQQWVNKLSPSTVNKIHNKWSRIMGEFDY